MRRSSTLTCLGLAVFALPLAGACASSQQPVDEGDGGASSSSGSGSGGNNGGNSSGSGSGGNSSGSSSGTGKSSSSGSGSGATSSSSSGSGSGGTSSSSSGSGSGGTSSSSSGSGSGGTSSSSSGSSGVIDAGASTCGTPGPNVLSDFEMNTGDLVPQGGRTGWWYVYSDPASSEVMVPPANANGPIATVAAPADDTKLATGDTCNKFALHVKAPGGTPTPGFGGTGATFIPNGSSKTALNLTAYDGIQFDIKNVSGTEPLYLELLTEETQLTTSGGLLPPGPPPPNASVAINNNRGYYLTGAGATVTNTSVALPATMSTVYVPFSLLIPRHFPTLSVCGVDYCQAPTFNPMHALGFQFSAYPDMNNVPGTFEIDVDNVALYTGDNGLNPAGATTASPTFNDGATGFAGCKAAVPTFINGGKTAAGKYLQWAYNNWKNRFFTGGKVVRPENGNDTVSEGIGYGMLLSVYFNDQPTFDALWSYSQQHLAGATMGPHLMDWCVPAGGGSCNNTGGTATDADEDMTFALFEAGKRGWTPPGGGASYASLALTLMGEVWNSDIDATNLLPRGGSNYAAVNQDPTNPSYFAPAYYRSVFAANDPAGTSHAWATVANKSISVIAALSGSNGLVPAWCSGTCTAASNNKGGGVGTDVIYQYDAHRVPWRIGMDVCWNGTNATGAQAYLAKIAGFFNGVFTAGGIDSIYDLYNLSGSACTASPCGVNGLASAVNNSSSVIGTAGFGAMAAGGDAAFVQAAWQFVLDEGNRAGLDVNTTTPTASIYSYFNATVGLLTALSMTGNIYPM
jgi:endo-1,4-beta-D-glucanase Y